MIVALFEADGDYLMDGIFFVDTDKLHNIGLEKELKTLLLKAPMDEQNPVSIPNDIAFTTGSWSKEIQARILVLPPFHLEKIVYANVV
jgi:hypothetical protein